VLGLARYAMRTPLHTGILAALFSLLPMGFIVSTPLVGLATLRYGFTTGSRVLGIALVGGVLGWLVFGLPIQLLFLPLIAVFALFLREWQSWGRALVVSAYVGVLLSFGLEFVLGDFFNLVAEEWANLSSSFDDETALILMAVVEARPIYKYVAANGFLEITMLFLLWARFLQAALFNPGGLKAELHTLRLSQKELLLLVLGAVLSAALIDVQAMALFSFSFVFAGMALTHGIVAKLKLGGQWLVATYIALVLFNQIILPLLVLLVLVDSVLDIRARIPERTGSDSE
jgi:hypothetical protein